MSEKKELAIVFGITANWSFALANVLMGIKNHSPDLNSDFIVYHDNLSLKDQQLLNSILPCIFINYKFPVETNDKKNLYLQQFSLLSFSIYECFNHLDSYNKVVWLDVDILIQKDINELIKLVNADIGLIQDTKKLITNFTEINEKIRKYNLESNFYCSGTVIFNDNLPERKKLTDWCYKKTLDLFEILKYPDQAILNLIIQDFKLNVTEINFRKFCCFPMDKKVKDAVIVHPAGQEKFWNYWDFKDWNQNYKNWLKMGGTPYNGKKIHYITRQIRKFFPYCPDPIRQTRKFFKFLFLVSTGRQNV